MLKDEKQFDGKGGIITAVASISSNEEASQETETRSGIHGFFDSFKPHEGYLRFKNQEADGISDMEMAKLNASTAPLKRSLKNRHLQMIAIGGSIGTGLFVGSGSALRKGGPAALLIAWSLTGLMMFSTVQALGELAVCFPSSGGFTHYNARFISPAWAFCMAWNYALAWCCTLPLELVAASMTIKYWNDSVNPTAWVSIFLGLIIVINLFGVRGYGEAEFVFSAIKVIAILGFIILGIILNCGGGPKGGYIGGLYWHDPGAFANGFKGVCSVFVTSAFSFGGTELCGLAAAETENPRKSLPKATKQVFWRITLFYLISLTLVGLLVPYTSPRLLGSGSSDAAASPFVIAIVNGGIKGLPSVMNVVIMVAASSVANSCVFGSSRTIVSLADHGFAPKWFGYIDRSGRPLTGILINLAFGFLCYLVATGKQGEVFDWLLSISGLSSIFTWASICFCHLRFRRALTVNGRDTGELSFTAQTGIYGSIFGIFLNMLIIIAQFWVALYPIGSSPSAANFFQTWLCVPILIATYIFYFFWKKDFTFFIKAQDIDIDSGRRETDIEALRADLKAEREAMALKPFYYRAYRWWC
ncbi:hypothetical protein DAMA08_021990 [Martiniozyma asiatica (nom. inval.)]|nr:hypothetical protein DAMA08_021990 [Martiniozyma asiatica]